VTSHVHDGSDPDCDRCWDVVIDQQTNATKETNHG
jgi:hypothetical protein